MSDENAVVWGDLGAQRLVVLGGPPVVEDGADERGDAAGAPAGAVVARDDEDVHRLAHVILRTRRVSHTTGKRLLPRGALTIYSGLTYRTHR